MKIEDYYAEISLEFQGKSKRLSEDFKGHRLTSGASKEKLVQDFLSEHLPDRFLISSGFVMTTDRKVSKEVDVLIADGLNNSAYHARHDKSLWPVEAVYAQIEVKSNLSKHDLKDAVEKCREFKSFERQFLPDAGQNTSDSLSIIWGFAAPSSKTLKRNLDELLVAIPENERPDLVIVLGQLVARCGCYYRTSEHGQPNSARRKELELLNRGEMPELPGLSSVYELEGNSLMSFHLWLDSWLRIAGIRKCQPMKYLEPNGVIGKVVV